MPMQQVRFDPARRNDFELVLEVGDTLSDEGLTRARLNGSGTLVVEQLYEKEKEQQFSGELDRESTENLFRQASQFNWEQRFPSRRGLPDEAIVQWYLRERQGSTITLKVWLRDAEKPGPMAMVLAGLRKSVELLTSGKLYL